MEWVVKVRDVEPENRCLLLHPLSTSLPLEPNSESFPDELNVLEFQVLELARCYSLRKSNSNEAEHKVVVSSDPHWHAPMVMAEAKLYYWDFSTASVEIQECTLVRDILFEHHEFEDVIFHKSKFYVVAKNGTTVSIDSSLKMTQVAYPTTCSCSKKLVESLGDLLLVVKCARTLRWRCPHNPTHHGCKVYKLNEPEKQWVEMKSLNKNRSLFVGDYTSFSASTLDIPRCLGNHIFFSSDPYLGFHRSKIKLFVRLLMDAEVVVVEVIVNEHDEVGRGSQGASTGGRLPSPSTLSLYA
ncbi:F-box protein At2g17036-like [Rosa rugosa]|uniref:F-box protein At2g17036-like n=1 Tax=Rosa rugosa TaxID=74645 RepID=UPI002B40B621|nr:F-box protein At2g17036-like [Rosa rugosa]